MQRFGRNVTLGSKCVQIAASGFGRSPASPASDLVDVVPPLAAPPLELVVPPLAGEAPPLELLVVRPPLELVAPPLAPPLELVDVPPPLELEVLDVRPPLELPPLELASLDAGTVASVLASVARCADDASNDEPHATSAPLTTRMRNDIARCPLRRQG